MFQENKTTNKNENWGAEAILQEGEWLGYKALSKIRVPKPYRIKQIDDELRRNRTIIESRLIISAKECGVRTPYIFEIDLAEMTIVMERIEGILVKNVLNSKENEKEEIVWKIGFYVGKLHSSDIIHGDLTTSNIIKSNNEIIFIDFGLGKYSQAIEDKAVDILLLKKCLISTHTDRSRQLFYAFQEGYKESMKKANSVFKRAIKVEARGRHLKEEQLFSHYLLS